MRSVALAAGLVVGLGAAGLSGVGMGDEDGWRSPSVSKAHSAPAQGGRKLKWLPYRPSQHAVGSRVARTEPPVRTAARGAVRTVRRPSGRAFEDPFGDTRGGRRAVVLAAAPGEGVPGDYPAGGGLPDEGLLEEPPTLGAPGESAAGLPVEPLPGVPAETEIDQYPLPAIDEPQTERPCPSPGDPDYHTKISALSADIAAEKGEFPRECTLTEETIEPFALGKVRRNAVGHRWAPTTFTWKASALCHKPLYFEEKHIERYGHSWGPWLQPLASGAHFFLTVPALPYKMGIYPPCECMYTLGYYRPGSCAPRMIDPLPLSVRAVLAEGGVWTGMAALIP